MKLKLYTHIFLFIFMVIIVGCKSATKLYDNGNYDEAVDLSVKKLQKKPSDKESKKLLLDAYRFASDNHNSQIKNFSENNNELKWEWIYNEYAALQNLYNTIRRSPEAYNATKPTDYSSYLNTYADKAADVRIDRGMQWMEKNDKPGFKNAYQEFNTALNFRPGDMAIKSKLDEAYENAVTNVVVMPMDNYGFRTSSYNTQSFRDFENNLLRKLQNNSGNSFTRYFSDAESRTKGIEADDFIDFRFNTQNIGKVKDQENVREVSKEIVVKEIVYKPDSIVKEYKKIFAKVITTTRTINSEGTVLVNIRDKNGRRIWSDDVSGNYNWKTEFATYNGDERALSESDKQLVNNKREPVPEEREMIRQIINEVNNNLYSRLRNYYSRN